MPQASQQHALDTIRRPRVQITYDVETNGAMVKKELPFINAVLADLCGHAKHAKAYKDRDWTPVDRDNFNEFLGKQGPGVNLRVENTLANDGTELPVSLRFRTIKDFDPAAVVNQIPVLKELLDKRDDLQRMLNMMDGKPEAEELLTKIISDMQKKTEAGGAAS